MQSGGPDYDVPLGRRDGLNFATRNQTLDNLPPPTSNTTALLTSLARKNLDPTDVVALSGGHTIGISHCNSFTPRLYPTQDPTMEKTLAADLKAVCPTNTTNNTTFMDIRSPNEFDNKYYVGLVNRQGLFTSDQDLYTDERTRDIVKSFADDEELFFEKFVRGMIKMGQLSVLTGRGGEIRANCSVRNSENESYLKEMVDVDEESRSELRKQKWQQLRFYLCAIQLYCIYLLLCCNLSLELVKTKFLAILLAYSAHMMHVQLRCVFNLNKRD